jgi:HEAT repeat protein
LFAEGRQGEVRQGRRERTQTVRTAIITILLAVVAGGCANHRDDLCRRLWADNPRIQTAAIAEAARTGDVQMVGLLVPLLESNDEAVRFVAGMGIHKLVGDSLDDCLPALGRRRHMVNQLRQWQQDDGAPARPEPSR